MMHLFNLTHLYSYLIGKNNYHQIYKFSEKKVMFQNRLVLKYLPEFTITVFSLVPFLFGIGHIKL